jgi:hypothetical protein
VKEIKELSDQSVRLRIDGPCNIEIIDNDDRSESGKKENKLHSRFINEQE